LNCHLTCFIVLAGEVQTTIDITDAHATGYDLTITPIDSWGNVGLPVMLTVIITGYLLAYLNMLAK